MNRNHKNYEIYSRILADLYDDFHILGRTITNEDYIQRMKHEKIYEWYISEKLKDKRKEKLKKINNEKI